MELTDYKTLRALLERNGFDFRKSLGQNFLIDDTVCPKMAQLSCCDGIGVLEIGPGAGVLTQQLAMRAAKVVCIEIDTRLKPVLNTTLASFDNVEVIFGDCMKLDLHALLAEKFGNLPVVICANLPYYLTSPILMKLLEEGLPVLNITVMIQKEAAIRLCAELGQRESSAVTAAVRYYANPTRLFSVKRDSFTPPPKVDSEVIQLTIKEQKGVGELDKRTYFRVIKAAFSMRRKTVANCLSKGLGMDKNAVISLLTQCHIDDTARAESITQEQFVELSNLISQEAEQHAL